MNGLQQLKTYLAEITAKRLWAQPTYQGGIFKAYSVNGKLLIIQEMADGSWEAFAPIADSISAEETLAAVRAYCEPPTAPTEPSGSPFSDGLRNAFDRVRSAASKL